MMKWFYDSLETLQKVDFAKRKDYVTLGIGVLVSIIIFGAFFIGVDTLGSGIYKGVYNSLRGGDYQLQQQLLQENPGLLDQEDGSLLDGVSLDDLQIEETTPEVSAEFEPLSE